MLFSYLVLGPYSQYFIAYVTKHVSNKLECLFPVHLPSLILWLWLKPGAYIRVEHIKGASIG
jgi:hypothetical protein